MSGISLDSDQGYGHGESFSRLLHFVSKIFQDQRVVLEEHYFHFHAARVVELLPPREKIGNAGPSTPLLLPGPAKYTSEDGQDATSKELQATSPSCHRHINYRVAQNISRLCF